MPTTCPYPDALGRVRELLALYAGRPEVLPLSVELEERARGVAHAARRDGVTLASAVADLGRLAAEAIPVDQHAALQAARAMSRWAAREYHDCLGASP